MAGFWARLRGWLSNEPGRSAEVLHPPRPAQPDLLMPFATDHHRWLPGSEIEQHDRRSDLRLPATPGEPDASASFVEGHNEFALALCGEWLHGRGNFVFAPLSVRMGLALVYAGALGETAAQMREVLRFAASNEALQAGLASLVRRLSAGGGGRYQMVVANSLWGQDGVPIRTGFLNQIAWHQGTGISAVDFGRDPEGARERINRWIADRTQQRIRDLVPPRSVGPDTRMVLANAICLRGRWESPFDEDFTTDSDFHLESGARVLAPLMHQSSEVRHVQAEGWQAVDLEYEGGELSLLVLLPDKRDGLRDLQTRLTARMLVDCVVQMAVRKVDLFLPRFRLTWGTADQGSRLRALGMPLAFSRFQADFSGINGREPAHQDSLFLSAVFHRATIDVSEEGTEATAATAVLMEFGRALSTLDPPPVPVFRADHPFLFAIRDRLSGAILFLGRLADPTAED